MQEQGTLASTRTLKLTHSRTPTDSFLVAFTITARVNRTAELTSNDITATVTGVYA